MLPWCCTSSSVVALTLGLRLSALCLSLCDLVVAEEKMPLRTVFDDLALRLGERMHVRHIAWGFTTKAHRAQVKGVRVDCPVQRDAQPHDVPDLDEFKGDQDAAGTLKL